MSQTNWVPSYLGERPPGSPPRIGPRGRRVIAIAGILVFAGLVYASWPEPSEETRYGFHFELTPEFYESATEEAIRETLRDMAPTLDAYLRTNDWEHLGDALSIVDRLEIEFPEGGDPIVGYWHPDLYDEPELQFVIRRVLRQMGEAFLEDPEKRSRRTPLRAIERTVRPSQYWSFDEIEEWIRLEIAGVDDRWIPGETVRQLFICTGRREFPGSDWDEHWVGGWDVKTLYGFRDRESGSINYTLFDVTGGIVKQFKVTDEGVQPISAPFWQWGITAPPEYYFEGTEISN